MAEHVYFRTIDPEGDDSLAEIVRRLPSGQTVLDIGCGVGALGLYLAQQKACTVDGIDLEQSQLPAAKAAYRRFVQADLEQADLTQIFADQQYDAIVLADVLEHLRDPLAVLRQAKKLLHPQGSLYVVLPNVAFIGVLAELCLGQFTYRDRGLLDRTHLRFFDRQAVEHLVAEAGFHMVEFVRIVSDLIYTEFGCASLNALSPAVRRFLLAQEEALTYQFLLVIKPTQDNTREFLVPPAAKAQLYYAMQFFWGDSRGHFSEDASVSVKAQMETEQQTIQVPVPNQPLGGIRWDPSDRLGTLDIYAVRLLDAGGSCLWTWQDPLHTVQEWNNMIPLPDTMGPLLRVLLTNDDPSLCLPVPPELLQSLPQNSRLEVSVSWPRSPDWLALAALHQQTEQQLTVLSQQANEFAANNPTFVQEKAALDATVATQKKALQALQMELESLRGSLSWRITRPLRQVKKILRQIAS